MGRFRLSDGPFWMYSWAVLVLTWAVLVVLKIYGPFWFMGRFRSWAVLVVSHTKSYIV